MKQFIIYIISVLTLTSCDCFQHATGIVLDRQTRKPIENVSLYKFKKNDSANSYSKRIYTDKQGQFDYHCTSGGLMGCPDLILYFNKQGYKTIKMTFESFSTNDTVFLDKVQINKAPSSLSEF